MIHHMALPRVAVLRGGMSNEYDVSLKTGASVCRSLQEMGYPYKDITITRSGEWLDSGRVRSPEQALLGIDVVFIALHGEHGEDGRIQRYLSNHHIPYTGSRGLASATALNKAFTKRLVTTQGIRTPQSCVITRDSNAIVSGSLIPQELGELLVLKPVSCGSSLDTHVGITPERAEGLLRKLLERYDSILVEECIVGKEITVGVLEQFRNSPYYCLPPIEIEPPQTESFYSFTAKYGTDCVYHCPARLASEERKELELAAMTVHRLLDLRHYSRSDFIVSTNGIYFLEVNTLPGLTETSLFPKAMNAIGADHKQLVAHLVANAHY